MTSLNDTVLNQTSVHQLQGAEIVQHLKVLTESNGHVYV